MQCATVWLLTACLSISLCVVSGGVHVFSTQHTCHGDYNTDLVTTAESMKAQVLVSQDLQTIRHLRHKASAASPEMLLLLDPKCSAKCATIGYDVTFSIPSVFQEFLKVLRIDAGRPVHVEKQVCVQGGRSVVQTTSVSDYVLSDVRVRAHNTFPDAKTMHSVIDLHVNIPWYAVVLRSKILYHLKEALVRGDKEFAASLCGAGRSVCRVEKPVALPVLSGANLIALARGLIMTKYFS
jgi:hypothetical protein